MASIPKKFSKKDWKPNKVVTKTTPVTADNHHENSTPRKQQEEVDEGQNYKLILAIKQAKEHSAVKHPNIKCIITIQDKSKNVTLPFTEGQLNEGDNIYVKFQTVTNPPISIGEMTIPIAEEHIQSKESELFQDFAYTYDHGDHEFHFRGSVFCIILNKTVFLRETPSTPIKAKKEVQFHASSDGEFKQNQRSAKRHPTGGQPLKRQGTGGQPLKKGQDVDPHLLAEQVDLVVNSAIREMKKAHEVEEAIPSYEPNRISIQRAQTIQQIEDGGEQLSENIQIMRQSTRRMDDQSSPSKLEKGMTFQIDDQETSTPNRLSTRSKTMKSSASPTRHTDNYDHHCHENLTCLYYIDQANQSNQMKIQNDYLKKVIYALDKKLKSLSAVDEYHRKFQEELEESGLDRQRLHDHIKKAREANDDFKGQIHSQLAQLANEKSALMDRCQEKDSEIERLNAENRQLSNELKQQQLKNSDLDKRLDDQSKLCQRSKELEAQLAKAEQRADESERSSQERAAELAELLDLAHRQRQMADQKTCNALQRANEIQAELDAQRLRNQELKEEIKKLQLDISSFRNKEGNARLLQEQLAAKEAELQERIRAKQQADLVNEQLRKQILELHNRLNEKERCHNEKLKELRRQVHDLQHAQAALNAQNAEKTKQNIQLKQELKIMNLGASLAADYQKQLEEEKVRSAHYHKTQQALVHQNQEFSQTIHAMSKQTNSLELQNQALQEELSAQEVYGQNLKKLICEMQEKNIAYIPHHSDPIDKALSDFINGFYDPHKLSGLFVREAEGIYQFGTKKLYIKIEQDKILIRTGGGFIGIEEFLDVYTPQELDKMIRLSPKAQKQKNQNMSDAIDTRGKVVKEIVHPHQSPLKVRTAGPVFKMIN